MGVDSAGKSGSGCILVAEEQGLFLCWDVLVVFDELLTGRSDGLGNSDVYFWVLERCGIGDKGPEYV